jgi:hypothetical protein
VYTEPCPHEQWAGDPLACVTFTHPDGSTIYSIPFQEVTFVNPSLGAGNDQYHLYSEWVQGAMGAEPWEPWPADAMSRDADGNVIQLPGWDSRVPLQWVLEHPQACHLVPDELIIHIGEWDIFQEDRYSDACDYTMTCMYEERAPEIYTGRPYWFVATSDHVLFYLSMEPVPTASVTDGFCFPDVGQLTDEELAIHMLGCSGTYFEEVRNMFAAETFMFVRAKTNAYMFQRYDMTNWFPHRFQLLLRYWQKMEGGVYKKRLIEGSLTLADFQRPTGTQTVVRGYEYDLRITFVPVPWSVTPPPLPSPP